MRSYKVYGIKDGGSEEYVDTIYSAVEGKQVHQMMMVQGYYDEIVVRDALGSKHIHRNLHEEEMA